MNRVVFALSSALQYYVYGSAGLGEWPNIKTPAESLPRHEVSCIGPHWSCRRTNDKVPNMFECVQEPTQNSPELLARCVSLASRTVMTAGGLAPDIMS